MNDQTKKSSFSNKLEKEVYIPEENSSLKNISAFEEYDLHQKDCLCLEEYGCVYDYVPFKIRTIYNADVDNQNSCCKIDCEHCEKLKRFFDKLLKRI